MWDCEIINIIITDRGDWGVIAIHMSTGLMLRLVPSNSNVLTVLYFILHKHRHTTHSPTHSFIYSFIHSFTHSLIHPLTHSLIHSFIHSLIHPFIHSFIHTTFIIDSTLNATPCDRSTQICRLTCNNRPIFSSTIEHVLISSFTNAHQTRKWYQPYFLCI